MLPYRYRIFGGCVFVEAAVDECPVDRIAVAQRRLQGVDEPAVTYFDIAQADPFGGFR